MIGLRRAIAGFCEHRVRVLNQNAPSERQAAQAYPKYPNPIGARIILEIADCALGLLVLGVKPREGMCRESAMLQHFEIATSHPFAESGKHNPGE